MKSILNSDSYLFRQAVERGTHLTKQEIEKYVSISLWHKINDTQSETHKRP